MIKLVKAMCAACVVATMVAYAQDAEVVKVKGRGVGVNKIEALKDAYRDAVERAVGLYVDAEQMMKNEELVKDQILTQSNAYIENYEVVKEDAKPSGLVEVQILAIVKKKALTAKVSSIMPAATYKLGGDLSAYHAKSTTVEKRNQDGEALLKSFLKDFDPLRATLELKLASQRAIITEDDNEGGNVAVNYIFQLEINQDIYFNSIVPKFRDILRQITISEPEVEQVCSSVKNTVDVDEEEMGLRKVKSIRNIKGEVNNTGSVQSKIFKNKRNCVSLIVGKNKHGSVFNVETYKLDDKCFKALGQWSSDNGGVPHYDPDPYRKRPASCFTCSLLDKENEMVFCDDLKIQYSSFANGIKDMAVLRMHYLYGFPQKFIMGPWHWIDEYGNVTFRRYKLIQFQVPKDVLPEIANMKIEMTNR